MVEEWDAPRAGLLIAGFEVPHLHVHVFPAWGLETFSLDNAEKNVDPDELTANATRLRRRLYGPERSG
jgi:diadenosine tetraphosphate (Ap4A) HIT family hydrolase